MGLAKLIAKYGTPGSTAKSVANGYKKIKAASPELTDKDIFYKIIEVRYSFMNDKQYFGFIKDMIDNNKINNICELVMEIIAQESKDYNDLPFNYKLEILTAVLEILAKHKVLEPSASYTS